MSLIMISTDPSADISAATNPEEANPGQGFEKADTEVITTIEQNRPASGQNTAGGTEPKVKKSLSFKLAFIGIAASLFVFQLDATCLGIALPVSLTILFFSNMVFMLVFNDSI